MHSGSIVLYILIVMPNMLTVGGALLQVTALRTSIVEHYNLYQKSVYLDSNRKHQGSDGAVLLRSEGEAPDWVGPRNVDDMSSSDQGVWHPDSMLPAMEWHGAGRGLAIDNYFPTAFNPFAAVPRRELVLAYTERLRDAGDTKCLQDYMDCDKYSEIQATRGNLPIAEQGIFIDHDCDDKLFFLSAIAFGHYSITPSAFVCSLAAQLALQAWHPRLWGAALLPSGPAPPPVRGSA